MQMATKNQIELALKAILTELNASGYDLYDLQDKAICRMHIDSLFIREDSHREKGGAEDVLVAYVKQVAGVRTPHIESNHKLTSSIEDF